MEVKRFVLLAGLLCAPACAPLDPPAGRGGAFASCCEGLGTCIPAGHAVGPLQAFFPPAAAAPGAAKD